uniref:Uncharacterized protein n=1 Tax=Romanomermis culicivorax TaxID=13658 RepID=A0A915HI92_ROMCU
MSYVVVCLIVVNFSSKQTKKYGLKFKKSIPSPAVLDLKRCQKRLDECAQNSPFLFDPYYLEEQTID